MLLESHNFRSSLYLYYGIFGGTNMKVYENSVTISSPLLWLSLLYLYTTLNSRKVINITKWCHLEISHHSGRVETSFLTGTIVNRSSAIRISVPLDIYYSTWHLAWYIIHRNIRSVSCWALNVYIPSFSLNYILCVTNIGKHSGKVFPIHEPKKENQRHMHNHFPLEVVFKKDGIQNWEHRTLNI